ncbi:MAG: hypothetical protein Ct9H300mP21_05570 [Pseudomonadota bacterium]|nr:MAG: hypothetical protein Ct9H300mP21_05570 [Pseudomonadota bacterium]
MMLSALFFSLLFLVSYLTYHAFHGDTLFRGEGWVRPLFLYFDFAHYSFCGSFAAGSNHSFFCGNGKFHLHPKIARITLPLWMYSQLQVYGLPVLTNYDVKGKNKEKRSHEL